MDCPKLADGPSQKSKKQEAEVETHRTPAGVLEITYFQERRQQAYEGYSAVEKMFVRNSHAAPITSGAGSLRSSRS